MANSTNSGEVEDSTAASRVDDTAEDKEEKAPESDQEGKVNPVVSGSATVDEDAGEKVEFKVIFNKKKYDVTFP